MTTDAPRLFLAFPADKLAVSLNQLQDQLALPGRRILSHQFHLTLRFLGTLTDTQSTSLLKQLPQMQLPRFELPLNQLGCFTRANVVWIGTNQVPEALMSLYQEINNRCGSLKLGPPHKAYRPHITLFRHPCLPELPTITPIIYRPTKLCLYRSMPNEQGPHYEILESWELNGKQNCQR